MKDIEAKRTILRHTCQYWMNAVDSNSFLWTALVLEPLDLWYKDRRVPMSIVDRFIICSGEEPISISIHASLERYPYYHHTYADLVIKGILSTLVGPQGDVLKRWTSFNFSCCEICDVSLLTFLGQWPAPLLTALEINCPGPSGGIIELNAPMLHRLVLHESTLFFAPPRGFLFMELASLTLSAPSSLENGLTIDFFGWMAILRQTPRLISLRLHSILSIDEFLRGPSTNEEIVELSYLQQIFINEHGPWKFLQYLRFPALATIKIDGAFSDYLCQRLMKTPQFYEHLSHLKHLWFRRGITSVASLTVAEGQYIYRQFLARLFPELDSLIVPQSLHVSTIQGTTDFPRVWPDDEIWRLQVFRRIRRDPQFPNRAVLNGGEKLFEELFESLHDGSSGVLKVCRIACLRYVHGRRATLI